MSDDLFPDAPRTDPAELAKAKHAKLSRRRASRRHYVWRIAELEVDRSYMESGSHEHRDHTRKIHQANEALRQAEGDISTLEQELAGDWAPKKSLDMDKSDQIRRGFGKDEI